MFKHEEKDKTFLKLIKRKFHLYQLVLSALELSQTRKGLNENGKLGFWISNQEWESLRGRIVKCPWEEDEWKLMNI